MPKARRIWSTTRWMLIVLAVLVVVFFLVVVPWFFTTIVTTNRYHFSDPNDGKTPESFGMPYQETEFRSSDDIDLKGWYMPAAAGPGAAAGTVIYCHGQNRTRVEMLPMAQFGHSLGYNGLAFDLRHQGASGGQISTLGYWERLDVEAAIRYALDEQQAARPIVVWGVSLGAAAALMAAAETPNVAAVISDSTFLTFEDTVKHHWKLFIGGPSFPITNQVIAWIGWRGHFRPSDFDLRQAVERINPRPILFVAVQGDRRMPPSIAQTLAALATSPAKMLLVVPGTRHGEGFNSGQAQFEQTVREFLAKTKASE